MILKTTNVKYSFGKNIIFQNVNLDIREGDVLCLLGKNGCGKSTLINCISKYYKTYNSIFINDKPVDKYNFNEYSKYVSTVPQNNYIDCNFDALTVVLMGRTPYIRYFCQPSEKDIEIARYYMYFLAIENLENRRYSTLSVGQQKMVLIAQSLAKETPVLVFDEPTAPLDLHNKELFIDLLRKITDYGKIIILSSHDPNDAFLLSNKVVLFTDHDVLYGNTHDILTSENVSLVYDVIAELVTVNNRQFFIFGGNRHEHMASGYKT